MYPYPSFEDFTAAAKKLVAKLRGDTSVDLGCSLQAGWVCAGYALSHVPHPAHARPTEGAPALGADDARLADVVENATAPHPAAAPAVNWALVLDVVLLILGRLLSAA